MTGMRLAEKLPLARPIVDRAEEDKRFDVRIAEDHENLVKFVKQGKGHPVAFVFEQSKGRVFQMPSNHDTGVILMLGTVERIRRGCSWSADQQP